MLFLSSVFIVIRYIREVHFSLFILFYGYVGTLECSLLAISFNILDIPHSLVDWLIAGGNAMLSFMGQILLTFALQAEFAGLVSLVRTLDVVRVFGEISFWRPEFLFKKWIANQYRCSHSCGRR